MWPPWTGSFVWTSWSSPVHPRCYTIKSTPEMRSEFVVRLRQRANHPPRPSILLANVQSLDNKVDELRARISFQRDIRDRNILCYTESWLSPDILSRVGNCQGPHNTMLRCRYTRGKDCSMLVWPIWAPRLFWSLGLRNVPGGLWE